MIGQFLNSINGNTIETYSNGIHSPEVPIVISMGNWEPAFRAFPILNAIKDRAVYTLSYRGRGKSTSPDAGYDHKDHANDLRALVTENHITKAIFIAFSKGVSYTLSFLEDHIDQAAGLILADYPAIHCESTPEYADYWYHLEYKGYRLRDHVSRKALEGIQRESTFRDFLPLIGRLECPILVFAGQNEQAPIRSNLSQDDILRYKSANPNVEVIEFHHSGHMIFDDELGKAIHEIGAFIRKVT